MINLKNIFALVFTLLFLTTYSQDKSDETTYGYLTGQLGIRKEALVHEGIAAVKGVRIKKVLGAGIGIEALKFKGRKSICVPVHADFRYFFPSESIFQLFFIAQAGYSLYNSKQNFPGTEISFASALTTKGGLFYGSGFGVSGKGKISPTLALRYTSYTFNFTKTGNFPEQKGTSRSKTIALNFGITF